MSLSPHFTLSEFTRSTTADRLGIDNTIPAALVPNLRTLCQYVLEPLRAHVGHGFTISSGYRCPQLNRAVGGVSNSQHQQGEAADLHLPSIEEGREWMRWIMDNCTFDQLLWERSGHTTWLHVSCKRDTSKNRHMVRSIMKRA